MTTLPAWLFITVAVAGLVVNTMAILAIAWRGGYHLGRMSVAIENMAGEVRLLRTDTADHARLLATAVTQNEGVERRLSRLEGAQ